MPHHRPINAIPIGTLPPNLHREMPGPPRFANTPDRQATRVALVHSYTSSCPPPVSRLGPENVSPRCVTTSHSKHQSKQQTHPIPTVRL
jgi:hypothetical protein